MGRRLHSTALRLVGLGLVGVSVMAQAQPSSASAAFDEGRTLLSQGRVQEACERFAQSHAHEPALGTLLNLADCRERLGATATAFTLFNEAQAWAERTHEAKRAQAAKERATALRPKLSMLVVELLGAEPRATAEVRGPSDNAVASWNLDIPQSIALDPGRYALHVKADGAKPATVPFVVSVPGVMKVLVPVLERTPVAAESAPAPRASVAKPVEPGPPSWVAPTVLALGAAVAIGCGVLLGFALDVLARTQAQQTQGMLTVTRQAWQAAVAQAVAASIGAAVGLGAVTAGIVLLRSPSGSTTAQVSMVATW